MARGIHGRAFRPGTRRRRFDPRLLLTVLRESQENRADDIEGAADGASHVVELGKLYAHRRVRGGGEQGGGENRTFDERVEYVTRPKIRINVPAEPPSGMGYDPLGRDPLGARQPASFRINGFVVEPGNMILEPDGTRRNVVAVTPLPDRRVLISCDVETA